MARTSLTVEAIAKEAGLDLDEVLVALWDAGLGEITDPKDRIPANSVRVARAAVGLPNAADIRRPEYWCDRLGMGEVEFKQALAEVGIHLSAGARTLPKGAVSKLRKIERDRFGTVISGATRPVSEEPPQVEEEFEWTLIGHQNRPVFPIGAAEIERIHFTLVKEFAASADPIFPPGVKDRNLLESAASRPMTANGDQLKYPTPEMAAAALLHSIVNNHAFHNGNKRTGVVSMAVMLYENGFQLTCTQDELFKIVLQSAQHRLVPRHSSSLADREVLVLADWIRHNSRLVEKGEHVVKWHQLKRILSGFGVTWGHPGGVGNRINLTRTVERQAGAIRRRTVLEEISTQIAYQSDGADVPKNTLAKIRRDLELDEDHGIDSTAFYGREGAPETIISEYQRMLRRLARL